MLDSRLKLETFDLTKYIKVTYNDEAIISRQKLINETMVHVRSMKVLGEPTDQPDTPLLYHVLVKLNDTPNQNRIHQKSCVNQRTFTELVEFLRDEAKKT